MKKQRFTSSAQLVVLLAAMAFGVMFWLPSAMSQDEMKEIKAKEFGLHTRPPAVFMHDAHNEKAKLDDCTACHHSKDEATGRQTREDTSAGLPCAECHAVNASPGTPLMRAYHQQCIGCHREKNLGPTHCGGCHARGVKKTAESPPKT